MKKHACTSQDSVLLAVLTPQILSDSVGDEERTTEDMTRDRFWGERKGAMETLKQGPHSDDSRGTYRWCSLGDSGMLTDKMSKAGEEPSLEVTEVSPPTDARTVLVPTTRGNPGESRGSLEGKLFSADVSNLRFLIAMSIGCNK